MTPRLSIRDLAAKLDISPTTVSLALRNSPRVAPTTRKRVQQAARRLGYHQGAAPSIPMARVRICSARESLGFITAWPTRSGWRETPSQARFFAGAQRRALEIGYALDEFWLYEPGMTGRRLSRILQSKGIRGLVLCPVPCSRERLSIEWKRFACVTHGLTVRPPAVHRVVSSRYEDMQRVLSELARRRYRRIGLVLGDDLTARIDRGWFAFFLLYQNEIPEGDRIPVLTTRAKFEEGVFAQWFSIHRPDAILFSERPVQRCLVEMAVRVPGEVGLVHLDWSPSFAPLAGMDSDPETLGSAAIDLLSGQLRANEFGPPRLEKIIAVRGQWVNGRSIRAV